MTRRDPRVALIHMGDAAREAVAFVQGRARADLDTDRMLNLALVRLVEVIGEAATRVPPEVRAGLPDVPWTSIVGARNRLIHGYDSINLDRLWDIITVELPPLITALEHALAEGNSAPEPGGLP